MNILITSATAPFAQALAAALSPEHNIRLTERASVPQRNEIAVCPLAHDLSTNLLVRGMEAIIHVAEPLSTDSAEGQIDHLTRATYNLCLAAANEGVRRLIYLNTLDVMARYDPNYTVTERWRPVPSTEAGVLAKHLGEYTCREFAREHKLQIISLRLGHLTYTDDAPADSMALPLAEAIHAIQRALVIPTGNWSVIHLQHESPTARFSSAKAQRIQLTIVN